MRHTRLGIIDGNNWAWAAYYAYINLSFRRKKVGIIFGLPSMIASFIKNNNLTDVIVVYDSAHHPARKKLNPDYKLREKKESYKDFIRQKKAAQSMLSSLGITQIKSNGNEADDVIYYLTKIKVDKYADILIGSNDKDYNQLVSETVKIYNHKKKTIITEDNMWANFGYRPHQCVSYLSMVGDASDNIKGIPGIGPTKAASILSEYETLENVLELDYELILRTDLSKKEIRNIAMQIDLELFFNKYIKTMKLSYLGGKRPKRDLDKFKKQCYKYGITKISAKAFSLKYLNK